MKQNWFKVWLLGALLAGSTEAALTTNRWAVGAGFGKWEDGAKWDNGVPALADAINIISANVPPGGYTVTIDAATVLSHTMTGCLTISNLLISGTGPNPHALFLNNASDTPGNIGLYIENRCTITGSGSLSITNSRLTVNTLLVNGFMQLNTGTLTNRAANVGHTGVGQMTVLDGTWDVGNDALVVGNGGRGTLTLAGGTSKFSGGFYVGSGATGVVWMTGGQLVESIFTSVGSPGAGQITVSNGTFLTETMYVGDLGSGTLTVAGGISQVTGSSSAPLVVGNGANATGTVWITGGQLIAINASAFSSRLGQSGFGQMTVSNGEVRLSRLIVGFLGGSSGTLTIAGGTNQLTAGSGNTLIIGSSTNATGAVWITGGQLVVPNGVTIIGSSGIGQLTLSNGTWLARSVFVATADGAQGTLTAAGGTSSVYSNLTIGNFPCSPTGTVVVAGGNLFVTNATASAVLEVRTGSLLLNSGTLTVNQFVMTNACGNFIHIGGTLIYGSAVLSTNRDDDADGISNGYEQSHGLDPLNAADANVDSDGDGLSNLQEFLAGTDATNSVSTLRITSISQVGTNILVTWRMGAGKTNALERSSGVAGSFSTNFATIFTVTNTVGTVTNYLDIGAATNSPSRYYRIRLVP